MDHNEISGTNKESQKKNRPLKMLAVVALILLPTVFAFVAFTLISDGFSFGEKKSLYEIQIYNDAGILIDEDSAYPDEAKQGSIVALFSPITGGFKETTELPETLNKESYFRAMITYEGYTDEYVFYLSTTDDVGYCTVNQKKHYRLNDRNVHNILSSKYAEIFYKTAVPPTLYSSSGDEIIPESVSWRYKVASDEYFKSGSYDTSSNISEYVMSGSFSLYFSTEPDICTITISQNGSEIYSGNYSEMTELNIDKSTHVDVFVESEWTQKEDVEYHGRINYSFKATVAERPDFDVVGKFPEVNSFFIIKASNIEDPTRLKVKAVPEIPHGISFCRNGDSFIALVPVTSEMKGTDYDVAVSYGAVSESFKITTSSKEKDMMVVNSSVTRENYYTALSSDVSKEIESLKAFCKKEAMSEKLLSGDFLDYTDMGATLYANFNDYYRLERSNYYSAIGTEYRFGGEFGAGVPALNSGQVIKTGYNARLGNYIIVSHGVGIATWYSHLSIIDVQEGQYVVKGEILGKTGISGLAGDDNVTVIATVGDEFIDVRYLIQKEL